MHSSRHAALRCMYIYQLASIMYLRVLCAVVCMRVRLCFGASVWVCARRREKTRR